MTLSLDELRRDLEHWRDGDLTADAAARLRAAMEGPAAARQALRRELRLCGSLTQVLAGPDEAAAWTRALAEQLDLEADGPRFAAAWRRRSLRSRRLLLAAAAVLLITVAGMAVWSALRSGPAPVILVDGQPQPLRSGVLVAAAAVERHVQWPDRAAEVTVGPGGRLLLWREGERVGLELDDGSAWFRAGPQDPLRPLLVRTPDCELQVLGTRWHCRVGEEGTAVAVRSGAVAVATDTTRARCAADHFALVDEEGAVTVRPGDELAAAVALQVSAADAAVSQDPPAADPSEPPLPGLWLVPDRHQAPSEEALLELSPAQVEPLHLEVRHRDVQRRRGDGLTGPWKAQNWASDGEAELFTERVDDVVVLTMRNQQNHGIMLSTWRRIAVPAGRRCEIVLTYRCRARGRLAVAINVDGRRSPTVQAPRVRQGWHTAVFAFDSGAQGCEVAPILLNQTTGPRHDVLLRQATLHVVGPTPDP